MRRSIPLLVTIESDPSRYRGERPDEPRVLSKSAAEQLLAHLATDLANVFPEIEPCDLAMASSLFDQTQVLRPGYPIFAALSERIEHSRTSDSKRLRVAVDPKDESHPEPRLESDPSTPPAILQILPLCVEGPAEVMAVLEDDMEHRFLEQGQLSAHSAKSITAQFGIELNHARFMTLTDLLAMLKLQLEHFGFESLWRLIFAALEETDDIVPVRGTQRHAFEFGNGCVQTHFETFDYWAHSGDGKKLQASASELAEAYAAWTIEYRQYLATLQAHSIPVIQYQAGQAEPLQGTYLVESSSNTCSADVSEITEHSAEPLGVLAISRVIDGHQQNYYPLSPEGLGDIHEALRADPVGPGGFAYPGRILCDADLRILVPERGIPDHV